MATRDMRRRRLPIGIQTLREIRESDCYYVVKTDFALRYIEQGKRAVVLSCWLMNTISRSSIT